MNVVSPSIGHRYETMLLILAMEKHSSLLLSSVNYKKGFIMFGPQMIADNRGPGPQNSH